MKSTTYALIAVAASCANTGHMWQVTGHICYCWSAR